MDHSPIFIAGANRSGTSLMYALLASHPNISLVQRTDMWRFFYDRYGDLSQEENFEQCLSEMLRYRRITRLEPDAARIRNEFHQGEPTYGRLFALFHEHRAERLGRERWGDKSLHSEYHADQVFAEFPDARMIHVMRDPRDRYASERKQYGASVASATAKWLASARAAEANSKRHANYLVVRYETLASQPEETLRQVCDFLGEAYTPVMLTMRGAPEHLAQGGDSSFEHYEPGEISTRSIGRFREVVSKQDIAFIQMNAEQEMAELDYALEPVQLSLSDRLQLNIVNAPLGRTRMSYWFAVKNREDRRGRTVPARRQVDLPADELVQER